MDCLAEACSHLVRCACVLLILSCKYASLLLFSWSGEFRSEKLVFLQSWESNVHFSHIGAFFTDRSLYSNENPSSWSHSNPLWGEVLPLFLNKVLCRMRTSFLRTMPFHTWSYQSLGMVQVLAVTNEVSVLPVWPVWVDNHNCKSIMIFKILFYINQAENLCVLPGSLSKILPHWLMTQQARMGF
jgi:hypothetical protein